VKSIFFLACALVLSTAALPKSLAEDHGPATVVYSGLSDHQKALFRAYVDSRVGQAPGRSETFYQTYWKETLNSGEPATFAAVTQALEHTALQGGLNALGEIDQVIAIAGDIPENPSSLQFNLQIVWKAGAYQVFSSNGFTYRIGSGHPGETGLSVLSSSEGLHLLFAKDGTANGHVHVDYRSVGLSDVLGMGEGHMNAYNSDVRAIGPESDWLGNLINNYDRHTQWFGVISGYVRNE